MAISLDRTDLEKAKFVESTATAGQAGVVALNADGSSIGLGSAAAPSVVGGNVAHDGIDSGNPLKVGFKAKSSLTGITLVAADDRTDGFADLDGVQIQKPYAPSGNTLQVRVANTDGASTALTVFDNTAGLRNYITTIIAYNSSATAGYVDILDGSGGTIIATIPLPATGGAVVPFPLPLRQPTAATALYFDVSAALSTVYLTFVGYKSKA